MARLNTEGLTLDNGALRELRGLLFERLLESPSLQELFTVLFGQRNGEEVVTVGNFGLLLKAAQGCNPTYEDTLLPANAQKWQIALWGIYDQVCFAEIAQILEQLQIRGDKYGDLSDNPYIEQIIVPRLEAAIKNELMRIVWLGDTEAAVTSDGGVIANAEYVPYFTLVDGFWKRALEIVAADPTRRTTIAANAAASLAAQKSAILQPGVATGILDSLIMDAPMEIRADGVIYMTQMLADALAYDLQKNNKGSELQWRSLFDGVRETTYQGVRVIAMPYLDQMIAKYEGGGATLNDPFRAIFTPKANMLVGTTSTTELVDVRVFYDEKDEVTYMKAKDYIGTMLLEPSMIQVAF